MAKEKATEAFVYILQCRDGTLYTGWTKDVERRLAAHQAGKASKYTRARLPVRLVFLSQKNSQREAMQAEWAIKQLSRQAKAELVANYANGRVSC